MNIGLFTDTYFPQINGVASSVKTLSQSLRKLGHNVYIFTPYDPNELEEDDENVIRMPSMPVIFVRQFRLGLVYSPKELSKIAHLHLDIIHTQTEFSLGIFGKILSKALHVPMVHTYHTMYEDYVHYIVNGAIVTPTMAKDYSRIFCNSTNAVVAPTEKVKHFLYTYGVVKPITIVPTGINIDKFRKSNFNADEINELKLELGLNLTDPIILSLGRVAKEKSIDVIINSMPHLLKKIPNAKLLIVGDGPWRKNLEDITSSLNICDSVVFAGSRPWADIGKYYQLGDVFVSASITETQGLTFVEAMAGGLPVIAKEDESLEGIIDDGRTGLLFSNNEELSEKLEYILNNPDKKEELSRETLKLIESLSAEAFGKNIEELYLGILENPEKFDFTKHHYLKSPVSLGKKAANKLIKINKSLKGDLFKKSRFIPYFTLTSKGVTSKIYKFKNRNK